MTTPRLATLLCLSFTACTASEAPSIDDTVEALICPVPTITTSRSLAVTDPTALARFSFQRVMTAITTTGNATNTPLAMYQA
jgi:hypothetical protein